MFIKTEDWVVPLFEQLLHKFQPSLDLNISATATGTILPLPLTFTNRKNTMYFKYK